MSLCTLVICTKTRKKHTQTLHRHVNSIQIINLVSENYVKQPSYCRSLCSNKVLTSSSKSKHMHERKDGYKKRKKPKIRSERDLLLLRNYRNKNIPGTNFCVFICFFLFKFWQFFFEKTSSKISLLIKLLLQTRFIATFVIKFSKVWSKLTTSAMCSVFIWSRFKTHNSPNVIPLKRSQL